MVRGRVGGQRTGGRSTYRFLYVDETGVRALCATYPVWLRDSFTEYQ